jgi:hypothetical protein
MQHPDCLMGFKQLMAISELCKIVHATIMI